MKVADAFWVDGELYVPVRFFAEARGLLFGWDPLASLVYIEGGHFRESCVAIGYTQL